MKLIVQPDAGIAPVVTAIKQAKKTIDVVIFRLDRYEMARALGEAVARGVHVRALTAHQNRGKMMILDSRVLHVYGFNFTGLDIQKSRSFGLITKNPKLIKEAMKLFEADFERQPYVPGNDRFVVSPENARDRLANFIKSARRQLLIYDPQLTDDAMLRLITERIKAGVDVKIIGKVEAKWDVHCCEQYPGKRLHIRAMIRDGKRAFLGSQSLRRLELEKRREVGVIITDESMIREMQTVFERDWASTDKGEKEAKKAKKEEKKAKKEEKELAKAS